MNKAIRLARPAGAALATVVFILFNHSAFAQTSARIRFGVIGDYGQAGEPLRDVAHQIKSWNPDFIVTTGDNNYQLGGADTIDPNIGQYFSDYIYPYYGAYPRAASETEVNRFFPVLGNHDYDSPTGAKPYLDYFTLSNNERFYDFVRGPVHFFVLDSNNQNGLGINSTSRQANWIRSRIAISTAPFKIALMHHSPYSSGAHGSYPVMQWPYRELGLDAVLSGHDHTYERLSIGGLPFFVNGLGGESKYSFGATVPGSQFRYHGEYGAMLVEADEYEMMFKFINRFGTLIDSHRVTRRPQAAAEGVTSIELSSASVIGGAQVKATVTLAAPAPATGTVVHLSSSNDQAAVVPASLKVEPYSQTATFTVMSKPSLAPAAAQIAANHRGQAAVINLRIEPVKLTGLTLTRTAVIGSCQTVTGTIYLSGPAPAKGLAVKLAGSNSSVAVPASVTVPANETNRSFVINTAAVKAPTVSQISALYGAHKFSRDVTVNPVSLKSISFDQAEVTGGGSVTASVNLDCACAFGMNVALSSTKPDVAWPASSSVFIPPGSGKGLFTVKTKRITSTSHPYIKAAAGAFDRSRKVTVLP